MSTYQVLGIPDQLGIALALVALALLLAPYLEGELGQIKIPKFSGPARRRLRTTGPAAFLLSLAMFAPVWPVEGSKRPSLTPALQAAAMELGFAEGSMLAQVALPLPLRQKSSAGFARGFTDLRRFMRQLGLDDAEGLGAVDLMEEGFRDANPISGAERILDGMNLIKNRLESGEPPSLMNANRIGFALGHTLETAAVFAGASPTPEQLQGFVIATGRYRTSLPEDLVRAQLPAELIQALRRMNVNAGSVEELHALIKTGEEIRGIVEKMRTGS